MSEKDFKAGGFLFSAEKDYIEAKEELESVEYFKNNTDLSNPKTALKLYNKLINNHTFHTIGGYIFLKELQEKLLKSGALSQENLGYIYIPEQTKVDNEVIAVNLEKYQNIAKESKTRIRNSRIINLFLVFTILAMVIIALYSNKTAVAKLEIEMINRYTSWEETLDNREHELLQREEALKEAEKNK